MLIAARKTFSNDGIAVMPYMEAYDKCVDAWFEVPCGIYTGGDFRIRVVCSVGSFYNGNRGIVSGVSGESPQPYFRFFQGALGGVRRWYTDLGPTDVAGRISINVVRDASLDDVYAIERTGGRMTLSVNGAGREDNYVAVPGTTFTVTGLRLFWDAAVNHTRRIYSVSVWNGGKLAHAFTPVVDGGVPKWLDGVDGSMYGINREDRYGLFSVGETVAAKSVFAG